MASNLMQVTHLSCDTACLSVPLWPCDCLSALKLSVWPSICSLRQFLFHSWCVILSANLSDVIQVQCARLESPGVSIRFTRPFLVSSNSHQPGFYENAHAGAREGDVQLEQMLSTGMGGWRDATLEVQRCSLICGAAVVRLWGVLNR